MVLSHLLGTSGDLQSTMHINDLFENALNEVFDYLPLTERVKCELVCRRWRQVLCGRAQRAIKLCFEKSVHLTKSICSNRSHQASANDVLYFEGEDSLNGSPDRGTIRNAATELTGCRTGKSQTGQVRTRAAENEVISRSAQKNGEQKFDRLLAKFSQTTAIHLQSKDIKLLRKSNVFAGLQRHAARLQHLEIELFEGPFTRNDLLLLFKNWTKSLKHLAITFHFDNGKYQL